MTLCVRQTLSRQYITLILVPVPKLTRLNWISRPVWDPKQQKISKPMLNKCANFMRKYSKVWGHVFYVALSFWAQSVVLLHAENFWITTATSRYLVRLNFLFTRLIHLVWRKKIVNFSIRILFEDLYLKNYNQMLEIVEWYLGYIGLQRNSSFGHISN